MDVAAQSLNMMTQSPVSTGETLSSSDASAQPYAKSAVLIVCDLWSPYLGLQLSILFVTLFYYEVFRYFETQRQKGRQGRRQDQNLIKGIIIALSVVVGTQTVFTIYTGFVLFVKHWGRSEQAAKELIYGNMISDALIATLVHGLYSWFLFNRVPRRRRWAAWLLVSSTMILSAGQLACCIMAAIGYAQSGPLALTAHDVHLIRTMFRVWLIITVCADSLICIGSFWTHRLWRRRATTLQWDEHSHRKPMSLVASLAQALIWVVLPGNVLSFVCTALALTLECIAEDRDTYSWILICLSKLHGLGIMVCLNMRDRTDSYIARSSGSSNRQPLKPLFITKEQYSPPSILIKPRAHLQDGECEEGRCQATRWSASPGAAQQASPMYPIRSSHNTAMRLEKEPTPGQRTLSIYSKQRFPLESVTPCKPPSFARHEFDTDSERERTGVEECGRTSADSDVTLTGAVNYFGGSNREWSSFGVKDRYKDLRSVSWQHPDDPEESEDGKLARHPQALLGKGSVMESSVAHAVPMMPVLAPSVTSPEHSLIQGEYHPGTPYWLTEACSTGSGRTGYLLHRQEAVATGRDSSSLGNLSPRTRLYRGAETTRS